MAAAARQHDYLSPDQLWWDPVALPADDKEEAGQMGGSGTASGLLTAAQVRSFVSEGWIAVDGLWPPELVARAVTEARQYFPAQSEHEDGVVGEHDMVDAQGQPWGRRLHRSLHRWVAMPFADLEGPGWEAAADMALNQISLHPRALSVAAQLMGTTEADLRISQSVLRPRYGNAAGDGEQGLHVDYGNNMLVVPPREHGPEAVACLLFYSDLAEAGAPTHLAKARPGEITSYDPAAGALPFVGPGGSIPSEETLTGAGEEQGATLRRLSAEERPVRYRPGTAVLYRLDGWHRGTAVSAGQCRINHHLIWRRAHAEYISWQGLAQPMSSMPPRYLTALSPTQRGVIGFPLPGHRYWTKHTVAAVGQRYPDMDMAVYTAELAASDRQRRRAEEEVAAAKL